MRVVLVSVLALIAAIVGGAVGLLVAAWWAGRLDFFRNPPGQTFFFVWGVCSDASSKGVVWEIAAALARTISAFGGARVILFVFDVRPTVSFAAGLVLVLLGWELRNLILHRRAPIPIPHEIRSLQALQAVARVLASVAVASLFLWL